MDDHNNPGSLVTDSEILSSFTNPNLVREYAFSISIASVPEPATVVGLASIFGIGLIGLACRWRRSASGGGK
jgi:hypothetical protein